MPHVTYSFFSGSEQVTSILAHPVTELDVAKRIAREISESPNQLDGTIIVRSRKIEEGGTGEWRGIAAVFINGVEIESNDQRYPHHVKP